MRVFLPLLLALSVVLSCADSTRVVETKFVVNVDRIEVPSSVAADEPISVLFFGVVGQNGCFSFDHFDATQSNDRLDVTVVGRSRDAGICSAVVVELRGRELVKSAPHGDEVMIVVHLADGSTLEQVVSVTR